MSLLGIVLLILLIAMLGGGSYGYRAGWYGGPYGHFPLLGTLLAILVVAILFGYLH